MMTVARTSALLFLAAVAGASARSAGSPVQKVVELLDECKAKIDRDLAAESKSFSEFASFCDDESSDKTHAIEVTRREIADIAASIEDSQASIANLGDEITSLGSLSAAKEKELYDATTGRQAQHEDFLASEKEMIKSIEELSGAVTLIKQGASFAQVRGAASGAAASIKAKKEFDVLSKIIESEALDLKGRNQLKSFLQSKQRQQAAEDDDLELTQPAEAAAAAAPANDGIGGLMENMQSKAEDTLSDLRKKEMDGSHSYNLVKAGLEDEISQTAKKLSTATSNKAAAEEALANAEGSLAEASKSKAIDTEYLDNFKMECQSTAKKWEERQRSATGELGAIAKAKEILVGGVKAALLQVAQTSLGRGFSGEDDNDGAKRQQLVDKLRGLSQSHKSFALSQLASMAASDPFGKVRGLIESMIEKLMKKAQEDATHEAFCQEEMGKSTQSRDDKTAKIDDYQTRIDAAESGIMQLNQAVQGLEAEIAETDASTSTATKVRNEEHADFLQASGDFRDSATAVARAVEVLKDYYNGASLAQISSHSSTQTHEKQPEFGGAQGDSAHTIISVLEMSEQDFTQLLAESEAQEDEAARAFKKLGQESRVSRATKVVDVKAKESEVKSLKVSLAHHTEDHQAVSEELESVTHYLNKLKPQCETKAMSYGERKAAREAEIEGLKESISILEGSASFVQVQTHLRK